MNRLVLGLTLLSVLSARGANAPAPVPAPAPAPQKVADHVVAIFKSHRAAALKKESAEDIAILEKGAKDFPKDVHIPFALALCYITVDDRANYLKSLEKAYALAPTDSQIALSYVAALQMNRQPVKALEIIKGLVTQYPNLAPVKYLQAQQEVQLQKYDEAIAILEPGLKDTVSPLTGQSRAIWEWSLATAYLYKGERAKAIDLLNQANNDLPQYGIAYCTLGEAYLKDGDLDKAGAALDQALALNVHYRSALYFKGVLAEKQGKADLAKASYQNCYDEFVKQNLEKDGQTGEEFYLMSLVCQKLGKKDEWAKAKAEAAALGYTFAAPWKAK